MRVGAAHCDQCRSQAQVDARTAAQRERHRKARAFQAVGASTRVARRPIGRPSLRQAPKHAQQGIVRLSEGRHYRFLCMIAENLPCCDLMERPSFFFDGRAGIEGKIGVGSKAE